LKEWLPYILWHWIKEAIGQFGKQTDLWSVMKNFLKIGRKAYITPIIMQMEKIF
jgi:hypothetical protein